MTNELSPDRHVAGGVAAFPKTLSQVKALCQPEDLLDPEARAMYATILGLEAAGESLDLVAIGGSIGVHGGTVHEAAAMYRAVPSSESVISGARLIRERTLRTDIRQRAGRIVEIAADPHADPFELLRSLEEVTAELSRTTSPGRARSLADQMPDTIKAIQEAMSDYAEGRAPGITTGLWTLDRRLGGWRDSDLIILAGRPGQGKTALALQMIEAAAESGVKSAIFSLEMSDRQLLTRLIAARSGYPIQDILRGELTGKAIEAVVEGSEALQKLPILIDDTGRNDLTDLLTRARRYVRDEGVGLIVIDFLQLLSVKGSDGRTDEVGTVARSLKDLARTLDVPVIALSQLNRGVEARRSKRPLMADLRESGAIEEAADIVLFVYRPWYYPDGEDDGQYDAMGAPRPKSYAEIVCAKFRNGETGISETAWAGHVARFSDVAVVDEHGGVAEPRETVRPF